MSSTSARFPTATDIAFAVAVLAIIGSHLPSALRIFPLTLAVVDDLIAISIIAIFYSSNIQPGPLLLSLVPLAIYAFLAQKYRRFFGRRTAAAWGHPASPRHSDMGTDPRVRHPRHRRRGGSVATVSIDLLSFRESYYFREVEQRGSLPATVAYAQQLASEAQLSDNAELLFAGRMLDASPEDLAAVLRGKFGHSGETSSAVFDSYALHHKHRQQREPNAE